METWKLLAAAASLLGVATHIFYFQRYEYHRHLYTLIGIATTTTFWVPIHLWANSNSMALQASILAVWCLQGTFLASAICSTCFYRILLNPLNRFPGPYLARLTDFWFAVHVGKKLDGFRKLEHLHEQYGKIVRTGATHISISDPEFLEPLLGIHSQAVKGPWYDIDFPRHSLHEERNREIHDKIHRQWIPAFSNRALRSYEPKLSAMGEKLLSRISERQDRPMDVTNWFSLYAFDVMRAVVFGGGPQESSLDLGEQHDVFDVISNGMSILGFVFPPWFIRVLQLLPGNPMKPFHELTDKELEIAVRSNFHHAEKDASSSSIAAWLYKIYEKAPDPATDDMFRVDARLLFSASSGTVVAGLVFLFYLLAQHPEHVLKLREELRGCIKDEEDWTDLDINNCEHLNACIREALRLYPPGPSGVFRMTPPQGLQIGDVYIPGNTDIQLPAYIIQRDDSAFPRGNEFIPERWYSKPELIRNRQAWAPFAKGTFECIGKPFAMMELRSLTSKIVFRYNVSFAPGEDGQRLLNESKDHFSMTLAPLDLVFTSADS